MLSYFKIHEEKENEIGNWVEISKINCYFFLFPILIPLYFQMGRSHQRGKEFSSLIFLFRGRDDVWEIMYVYYLKYKCIFINK